MINYNFNKKLLEVSPSPTVAFADRIRELKLKGEDVISLHTGDPDFDSPDIIKRSICKALKDGYNHYSDSQGLPELRHEITKFIYNIKKISYQPAEILITAGAIHAYFVSISALFNKGDEIIVFTPAWPTHLNYPRFLGINVVEVECKIENSFLPTIEMIETAITSKTKGVVLNFPSNPTGAIADKKLVEQIVYLAIKNNIYIISDEVYETIVDEGKIINYPAGVCEKARIITISINSFSKSHALTGHRIGYIAANEVVINQLKKLTQYSITNTTTFIQKGLANVLNKHETITACNKMVHKYRERNSLIEKTLLSSGLRFDFIKPLGGFYYFINPVDIKLDSISLSNKLLAEKNVAMVPGIVYGNSGNDFIRMTFAVSNEDIVEGLKRLIDFYKKNI